MPAHEARADEQDVAGPRDGVLVGECGDDVRDWDFRAGDGGRGRGRLCGFMPAEPVAEDGTGDDTAAGAPVWWVVLVMVCSLGWSAGGRW